VTGVATEITGGDALQWAQRLPLVRWAGGDGERFVAISTELVSGRRSSRIKPMAEAQANGEQGAAR